MCFDAMSWKESALVVAGLMALACGMGIMAVMLLQALAAWLEDKGRGR